MSRRCPESFIPAAPRRHLGLEDFEEAGVRVAGRHFGAKDPIFLKVRLTHQDLANMIVSTREAVSKVMSEFQRDGLIEVRNRRIAISPRLTKARLSDAPLSQGAAA